MDKTKDTPHIVRVKDFRIDSDYSSWLSEIIMRYRSAQVKATFRVNEEKLRFNWSIGRDLVMRKAEERWGSGVVEQLSFDLQNTFPHENGFSSRNLWRMKQWYLFFSTPEALEKLPRLVAELQQANTNPNIKLPQTVAEIDGEKIFPIILGMVGWGQQSEIISKCSSIDEALFYLKQCIVEGLSRTALNQCLKSHLYENHGKALTNFKKFLPETQCKLAQEITKDNYDFGFVTMPKGYDEKRLEDALEQNITRFLLELGTGFAFVGRQKEFIVNGRSRRIDMLFYHIKLKAYVVVELKIRPFEPEFAGKLNYYVSAVDELLKGPDDNPTIGLLICSDKDETEVRWAFRGVHTPMGVASYDNVNTVDKTNLLPSAEELQARIKLLEHEINNKRINNSFTSDDTV